MSNCRIKFSAQSLTSNGHNNGFPNALVFSIVGNNRRQMSEKNGYKDRYNKQLTLKMIHINNIHSNSLYAKIQDILLSFDHFRAIFSTDVVFANQDNSTRVMIFAVSRKLSFSGKS